MTMNLESLLSSMEATAGLQKQASTETLKPAISEELAGILEKKASTNLIADASAQGEAVAKMLLEKFANEIIAGNDAMVAQASTAIVPTATGGDVQGVLEGTVNQAKASGATGDDMVNGEVKVNNVEPAGGAVAGTEKTAEELAKEAEQNKENEMNKVAQEDQSLAAQIVAGLQKKAQEFSETVTTPAASTNTAAAPVPNKIQRDNAVMTAADDAKVQGIVPGGDGSVNALFETIVAKAVAQGGGSDDLINGPGNTPRATAGVDGRPQVGEEDMAKAAQEDAFEKIAALHALVDAGLDFDQALDLVKEAEQDLASEAWEQEKQACLGQLMEQGVDFDTAVQLVKEAEQELLGKQ